MNKESINEGITCKPNPGDKSYTCSIKAKQLPILRCTPMQSEDEMQLEMEREIKRERQRREEKKSNKY